MVGNSWPGNVYWPDFTKPEAKNWVNDMLNYLKDDLGLKFDGIWLDMNEATSNCNGWCDKRQGGMDLKSQIVYVPGGRDLETMSIPLDVVHNNGKSEFDIHNMFSYYQVKLFSEYFTEHKKRPFVLSRSNFPGLGQYGHTWLADNYSL